MGESCYNLCINNTLIYKSTVSGVNVYDLETISLLNFIWKDYTSSVWANDTYMYLATSVSGIYRCETSTVTGTVTLEPYKQYPEITSNYVYCIHGCGDYLCATTESGVDHYNLTTGSGIYTTLSGVSKCFQTERGEFYYSYNPPDADKELHVVYDNTNDWDIETVGSIYTIIEYDADAPLDWLSGWSKRIKLTLDNTNVDDTLSDFPVLVKLSDSSGISSTDVTSVFTELGSDANRKKIAVTTSDEVTQCYVEIERFDYSNSVAELWVKVPSIFSGTTTDLYLYYDSTQSNNTTYIGDIGDIPAQNVWDTSFKLVMHMAQDPNNDVADAIKDSTSNANHGTPGGSMTTADLVDGKIGKAIAFDGNDDHIIKNPINNFPTDKVTAEVLMLSSDTSKYGSLISYAISSCDNEFLIYNYNNLSPYIHNISIPTGVSANDGVWRNIVVTWQGIDGRLILYKNEETVYSSITTAVLTLTQGGSFVVAQDQDSVGGGFNSTQAFLGSMCEIRLSNIARSSAWIKVTYYSNWDELVSFGSEEDYEEAVTLFTGVFINDLYVTEKTSRYNSDNVIFIATSNGVTVIEEKQGDEENSNFKYYYINT